MTSGPLLVATTSIFSTISVLANISGLLTVLLTVSNGDDIDDDETDSLLLLLADTMLLFVSAWSTLVGVVVATTVIKGISFVVVDDELTRTSRLDGGGGGGRSRVESNLSSNRPKPVELSDVEVMSDLVMINGGASGSGDCEVVVLVFPVIADMNIKSTSGSLI